MITEQEPKSASQVLAEIDLTRLKERPGAAEYRAKLAAENAQKRTDQLLHEAVLPQRHLLNRFPREGKWAETLNHVLRVCHETPGAMLGIIGTRGNGKTQLAVEVARDFAQRHKSALFTTAMGFFMQVKNSYRKEATTTELSVLHTYSHRHLLIIDEFDKRAASDWENALLQELINRRYNALKHTLLLANETRENFLKIIGESVASRMQQCGGLVECTWPSYRG